MSHPDIEYRSSRLGRLMDERVENLSLGPKALTTRFAVPLTLSEQRKVGIRGSRRSYHPLGGGAHVS